MARTAHRNTARRIALLLFLAVLVYLLLQVYGFSRTEYQKHPVVQNDVASGNYSSLYRFYVRATPDLQGRLSYGSQNASITFVAYLKIGARPSQYFLNTVFPMLERDYIANGSMRFIYKNHITVTDIQTEDDVYRYDAAVACVQRLAPDRYYPFLFALAEQPNVTRIPSLVEAQGIPSAAFQKCLDAGDFPELVEDASEVDNFGMTGINPRFYIGIDGTSNTVLDGVPSYTRLQQTIRTYQIMLGD